MEVTREDPLGADAGYTQYQLTQRLFYFDEPEDQGQSFA